MSVPIPPGDPPAAGAPSTGAPTGTLVTGEAARRLEDGRRHHLFTSDLTVNEFLLVRQAGFAPLGLVMGTSVCSVRPRPPDPSAVAEEIVELTGLLYHAREQAMNRLEAEAEALGADGVVGVRLVVSTRAFGRNLIEFQAIGTAVKHLQAGRFRNVHGRPFTSDLSGQDFWLLLHSGWRPCGLVMGNSAYYVGQAASEGQIGRPDNGELTYFTHALYDAREEAMERLQVEAEALQARGVVGVTVRAQEHAWKRWFRRDDPSYFAGEIIEFFVVGTAVVPLPDATRVRAPLLVIRADAPVPAGGGAGVGVGVGERGET